MKICRFQLNLGLFNCNRFFTFESLFECFALFLVTLIEDGLAEFEGERLRITDLGRPLVRCVCAAFDRHWPGSTGRHSRAI